MTKKPDKQIKSKQSEKASSLDNIIGGWLIISSPCIVAIIGYAISASFLLSTTS